MSEFLELLLDQCLRLQQKQYVLEVCLPLEQTLTSLGSQKLQTFYTLETPSSNTANGPCDY